MNESKTSKAQNLARIRDNQRRSRARRKQYLSELEAKLRSCEQMGIEASAEIQGAARKVLEENRRLRTLLRDRGVSEAEIVTVLGGSTERHYDHVSAAPVLNNMLERRIPCSSMPCTTPPPMSQAISASMENSTPAVPPISIPAQRSIALSSNDSPSPSSIVSIDSMGSPPGYSSTAMYSAPITPATEIKTEDLPYNFAYEQSLNPSWGYSSEPSYVPDSVSYYNTSSCVDAASIIRTLRSDVRSEELEAEFGCRNPGQDCFVGNNLIFNMMDKYSNMHDVRTHV